MSVTELKLEQKLVSLYLMHGSIEKVFSDYEGKLPVSYAEYHRVLSRFGIIKSAGRNSCRMSEIISFFEIVAKNNLPLKKAYKKMPRNFQTSLGTLYRIYSDIKKGLTRRYGTVLLISPYHSPELLMVGKDVSMQRLEYGKRFGSITFPITFSDKNDDKKRAITRVFQQEVFSEKYIVGENVSVEFRSAKLVAYIDIVDVRVSVFHLQLPKNLSAVRNFSSHKIIDHRYIPVGEIIKDREDLNLRQGILELSEYYRELLDKDLLILNKAPVIRSALNLQIGS